VVSEVLESLLVKGTGKALHDIVKDNIGRLRKDAHFTLAQNAKGVVLKLDNILARDDLAGVLCSNERSRLIALDGGSTEDNG
jgi:hypothetical protein